MKTPNITTLKKYFSSLKKMKRKYVTSELLSKEVGVYPDIINETFSYFDPMVNLDYQYNLMDLFDQLENLINDLSKESENKPHKKLVTKKQLEQYSSIMDFVYQKMSIGGLIDRSAYLTDTDLRTLKRLINQEQLARKNTLKKNKKKR